MDIGKLTVSGLGKLMRGKLAFTTIVLSVWIAIALMELTPAWALRFRTLHSFDYIDGANPEAGLIQAANRDIYGNNFGWRRFR